jgi:hypothetical protein
MDPDILNLCCPVIADMKGIIMFGLDTIIIPFIVRGNRIKLAKRNKILKLGYVIY